MKNKRLTYGSLRNICLVLFGLLLSSYGNERSHRSINQYIVESFLNRYSKFEANLPRFKNYMFNFDRTSLPGDYISRSGLFHAQDYANFIQEQESYYEEFKKRLTMNISGAAELLNYQHPTYEEKRGNKSAKEWIIHGGYSADVPEVHASLRHFYDPTKPANKRYLTDQANNAVMKKFQSYLSNPEINGVDWALGDQTGLGVLDHNYSWESGKKYIQGALQEADPAKRNNYMAKAWRSLGETLHMIADNGCPAHVRNDAHPLGNVDTYEEMMEQMDIGQFKNGTVPGFMKDKFNDKNMTARKIAHELAVFTNENFVSNETISGTDWKGNKVKQTAHPADEYKSPKISASNYEKNYYTRTIGETTVKQCTDSWYFGFVQLKESYPFVDEACVKSQANVLIPTIIEAGTNAMKWFIPELKVVINEIDEQGNIEGEVIHTPDNEYKTPIKYNGPVYIQTITLDNLTEPLIASNGKFSGKIEKTTSPVFAQIEFGGVAVRSENMNMAKANPKKIESVKIEIKPKYQSSGGYLSIFNNNKVTNFSISLLGYLNDESVTSRVSINKNDISVSNVYNTADQYSKNTTTISAKVVFDEKKTMILSLVMTHEENITFNLDNPDDLSVRNWIQTIEMQNVPIKVESYGDIYFHLVPDSKQENFKKSVKKILHQDIETYRGETTKRISTEENLNNIEGISFSILWGSN
jgi:hypothetical protein